MAKVLGYQDNAAADRRLAGPHNPSSHNPKNSLLPPLLQPESGKIAIVAAHPDDETIGVGGHLSMMDGALVLIVTNGAPLGSTDTFSAGCVTRAEYADLRKEELRAAMRTAGVAQHRLHCFDLDDQKVSFCMTQLARRLAHWFYQHDTGLVLTHAYEMGHPDHDAVALAVHAAAILLRREDLRPPRIVEFTTYHRGVDGRIVVGSFPPGSNPGEAFGLDPRCQAIKRHMFDCYASQRQTLQPFGTAIERFRIAPLYKFTAPPSANGAYYDSFAWGMRSDRWRRLAGEALQHLGIALC